MLEFLSNNWLWILLIGGMMFMHLGHGGHGGHGGGGGGSGQAGHTGHGGCGGHQHSGHRDQTSADQTPGQPHEHRTDDSSSR